MTIGNNVNNEQIKEKTAYGYMVETVAYRKKSFTRYVL